MRKYFSMLLLVGLTSFVNINAQDIITMRDGSTIEAKVSAITPEKISYQKWNNLKGPVYTTSIDKIESIKFQNGDVEVFNAPKSTPTTTQVASQPIYTNINQQIEDASKQSQHEGKVAKPNPMYLRNWMFGARSAYGFAAFWGHDGNNVSGTTSFCVDGSVRYAPNVYGAWHFQANLGFHRINQVEKPRNKDEVGFHDDYIKVEPMVGFRFWGMYMRTGITFNFYVGTGSGVQGSEFSNEYNNSVVVGWPFEIGWATKHTELGLVTNFCSPLYKRSFGLGTSPIITALQFGVYF